MIVEKLKKEDISLYKELIDEVFESSNNIDYYNNYDENNTNYEIIVAKENNKIIGSITMYKLELFTFSFQPAIEIFNVGVLKEYRNKGIAKKIFEYIIKYARENGYNSIHLTCLDNAYNAHKLYESIGMKRASSVKYAIYFNDN